MAVGDPADTIFALSSGSPPAAIAIIRISGNRAGEAVKALTGTMPPVRRPVVRTLRDPVDASVLDRALTLWFPGPSTVTGEDLAELHLHGGRAVIERMLGVLSTLPALRQAEPGEFTRRAFMNGRIDLLEAEGLADLLAAETEAQRRSAMAVAEGGLTRIVASLADDLLALSARVEAIIEYADDNPDEFTNTNTAVGQAIDRLAARLDATLDAPVAERLRDGIQVVIGGPPNAGKSSLLNRLADRDVAIVSPIAGTTRDTIEVPVAISGIPFVLTDTAGLRVAEDAIERIGVDRAAQRLAAADLVLWLSDEPYTGTSPALHIHARADVPDRTLPPKGKLPVSVLDDRGIHEVRSWLVQQSVSLLPVESGFAIGRRQRAELTLARDAISRAATAGDILLVAADLALARAAFDRLTGKAGFDELLGSLFGQFCLGK